MMINKNISGLGKPTGENKSRPEMHPPNLEQVNTTEPKKSTKNSKLSALYTYKHIKSSKFLA